MLLIVLGAFLACAYVLYLTIGEVEYKHDDEPKVWSQDQMARLNNNPKRDRTVTRVAWLKLREPFEKGLTDREDVREYNAKIYRVGNKVRIDIEDEN